jgi:predicted kinase
MVGPPACGKSTYIKDNIKEGQKWISRDAIRFAVMKQKNTNDYFKYEKYVFQQFVKQIDDALDDGFDVYADATHINAVSRQKLLRAVTAQPDEIVYIVIGFSLEGCVRNNKKRKGIERVSEKAIKDMCNKFELPPVKGEKGNKVILYQAADMVPFSVPADTAISIGKEGCSFHEYFSYL